MPKFRFKAVKNSGEVVVETLEAATRDGAIEAIRARDLFPISVTADRWFNPRLELTLPGQGNSCCLAPLRPPSVY